MKSQPASISVGALAGYLRSVLGEPVAVQGVRALGATDTVGDPKGFGYGAPFEVVCEVAGRSRTFVVSRTRPAAGFGHDYPADRAWQALYGHAAYNSFPRHVRSLDVGMVTSSGTLESAADATEFFQLVEKADGHLYWLDLDRLLTGTVIDLDVRRAQALARYLADAHATKRDDPVIYVRRVRELVGHGECAMGILDSLPHPWPPLPPEACEAIEHALVTWRWKLRDRAHRCARVHGDFHPWNILFTEGTEFAVLDRSRGEWGEPADDVAALAINYLFFGIRRAAGGSERGVAEPFRTLFQSFLATYLDASRDYELLETLPPFFAFRALVLAHPRWYPNLAGETRAELLHFAHCMAEATRFDPADLSWICGVAR